MERKVQRDQSIFLNDSLNESKVMSEPRKIGRSLSNNSFSKTPKRTIGKKEANAIYERFIKLEMKKKEFLDDKRREKRILQEIEDEKVCTSIIDSKSRSRGRSLGNQDHSMSNRSLSSKQIASNFIQKMEFDAKRRNEEKKRVEVHKNKK